MFKILSRDRVSIILENKNVTCTKTVLQIKHYTIERWFYPVFPGKPNGYIDYSIALGKLHLGRTNLKDLLMEVNWFEQHLKIKGK